MTNFAQSWRTGQAGEQAIARWLRGKGWTVLPVYEKVVDNKEGPRLFLPDGKLIAPDLLAFKQDATRAMWVEAKYKTAFTWHRATQRFTTGIDIRCYEHYLQVQAVTPWDVWLCFLHTGGQAKDSPPSPDGLYGNAISYLCAHENHRWLPSNGNYSISDGTGATVMVYWAIDHLRRLADVPAYINSSVSQRTTADLVAAQATPTDAELWDE